MVGVYVKLLYQLDPCLLSVCGIQAAFALKAKVWFWCGRMIIVSHVQHILAAFGQKLRLYRCSDFQIQLKAADFRDRLL